jgi:N-formylglutamate amidohydrolase
VQRNRPYAGGFITECYGKPASGLHAVQVEINRAIYMDERTLQKLPSFAVLRDVNAAVLRALLPQVRGLLLPVRAAAE